MTVDSLQGIFWVVALDWSAHSSLFSTYLFIFFFCFSRLLSFCRWLLLFRFKLEKFCVAVIWLMQFGSCFVCLWPKFFCSFFAFSPHLSVWVYIFCFFFFSLRSELCCCWWFDLISRNIYTDLFASEWISFLGFWFFGFKKSLFILFIRHLG